MNIAKPAVQWLFLDLNAFFASCEQQEAPALRGKPVIVGGSPDRRGVVATASYEARQYGVHSAMPSRTAYRLCPNAVFLPARFEVYRSVSQQVMVIFRQQTALVRVVLQCYYRDDRVLRSLGLELRAPFPKGHVLPEGDWSLLDPVRARAGSLRRAP